MSSVVVDTDVVSYIFKRHTLAARYEAEIEGHVALISFMTLAELDRWTMQSRWGPEHREQLRVYLEPFAVMSSDRTLCQVGRNNGPRGRPRVRNRLC